MRSRFARDGGSIESERTPFGGGMAVVCDKSDFDFPSSSSAVEHPPRPTTSRVITTATAAAAVFALASISRSVPCGSQWQNCSGRSSQGGYAGASGCRSQDGVFGRVLDFRETIRCGCETERGVVEGDYSQGIREGRKGNFQHV